MSLRIFSQLTRAVTIANNNARCMSFKSSLSIDKIYPNSKDIKPFEPPKSEDGKFSGYIPIKDLVITYSRASGAGGQHINKSETKVDIRFLVKDAKWISDSTKEKLIEKYYTRINKEGYFIVRSEKTKSQLINTAEALNYIREIIYKLEEPEATMSPETEEKIRKNKEKAARKRLMMKRKRSLVKADRQVR